MLFKEVDDCSICPFNEGGEYEDCCPHTGNPDHNLPCLNMDKWGNKEIEDVANQIMGYQISQEEYFDRQWEEEQSKKKKNEEKTKRAREARLYVYNETQEINKFRKKIQSNNKLLNFAQGFASAVNFANEAFNYNEQLEIKPKNKLQIENENLEKKIEELEKVKKEKLKELKNKRKEQKKSL